MINPITGNELDVVGSLLAFDGGSLGGSDLAEFGSYLVATGSYLRMSESVKRLVAFLLDRDYLSPEGDILNPDLEEFDETFLTN